MQHSSMEFWRLGLFRLTLSYHFDLAFDSHTSFFSISIIITPQAYFAGHVFHEDVLRNKMSIVY